ncbi:FAD-binding oxidoreductase [Lentzea sp. NPDC051213]|uniref:FAD-binding oxidoreductase n=1 Tax=Lentzea sp. NPDC051213 TaxID=3364126 RepID=UPI00378D989C
MTTTGLSRRRLFAGSAALGTAALVGTRSASADTEALDSAYITVTPGSPQYSDLVRGTNLRFTGTPDTVHLVSNTAQVVAAVQAAVRAGKRLAVRSGGHCYENFVADQAVKAVIDLSPMRSVKFDPARKAFAVEAGATLGEIYDALYKGWGVTIPAGACPTVGVGGHITGGGYGALSRMFGLSVDYLEAIEIVVVDAAGTARSVVATCAPTDPNRDLWWAHTGGGGGNFGVVTKFWFRTPGAVSADPAKQLPRPPSELLISNVSWAWSSLNATSFARLMSNFGRWYELNSSPTSPYTRLFSELKPAHVAAGAVSLTTQVDGTVSNADKLLDDYLNAINAGVGFPFAVAERRRIPWLHATKWSGFTGPDPTLRFKGKPAYQRKNFTPTQISAMYKHLTRTDYSNPAALLLISGYGGAVSSVSPTATAVAQRDSILKVQTAALWTNGDDDARHLAWVREIFRDIYADTGGVPVPNEVNDGMFINYADVDPADPVLNQSGVDWTYLYFKDNYRRLQQVKARWDPRDTFRHALSVRLP